MTAAAIAIGTAASEIGWMSVPYRFTRTLEIDDTRGERSSTTAAGTAFGPPNLARSSEKMTTIPRNATTAPTPAVARSGSCGRIQCAKRVTSSGNVAKRIDASPEGTYSSLQ